MTAIIRQRVHVSVAIEGTTGSSYLGELGQIYGPEHVLVYRHSEKKFIRLSELAYSPAQSILIRGKEILGNTPFLIKAILTNRENPGLNAGTLVRTFPRIWRLSTDHLPRNF